MIVIRGIARSGLRSTELRRYARAVEGLRRRQRPNEYAARYTRTQLHSFII